MNICPKCKIAYDGAERFCPKDGTRLSVTAEGEAISVAPPPAPAGDPLIGTVVEGRYKVIKQIGEGGMGVVYVAEHIEIEKKVALKVLRDDFSKRPEVVARFRQEARSASRIGNAHIVDVTDFGQLASGGVYFVMEYLQGQGLSDLVRREPLPLNRAVPIVTQIARALQAAHKLGIVHRDLKPENVFLVQRDDQQDFVKILDFGIAKISDQDSEGKRLTKTGMIFGTPEYMSPEQAAGKELDHRVDVYALGCIMFEMFTGRVPFEGESFMAVLTQHMFEPVPPIEELRPDTDVPPSVRAVVYKAMAKDKDVRYPDMASLESDLQMALADSGYVVDYPGRENTSRVQVPTQSQRRPSETALAWAPASGAFPQGRAKGGKAVAIAIAVVITLAVGGALVYFLGPSSKGRQQVLDTTAAAGLAVVPAAPPAAAPDTDTATQETQPPAATPSEVPTAPAKITVSIGSDPEGAVISVVGLGQVCSRAPCDVELEMGKPVEIEAQYEERSAKVTITPSEQNKAVTLVLKKPAARGGKRGARRGATGGGETGGGADGLKVPDLFKDH